MSLLPLQVSDLDLMLPSDAANANKLRLALGSRRGKCRGCIMALWVLQYPTRDPEKRTMSSCVFKNGEKALLGKSVNFNLALRAKCGCLDFSLPLSTLY